MRSMDCVDTTEETTDSLLVLKLELARMELLAEQETTPMVTVFMSGCGTPGEQVYVLTSPKSSSTKDSDLKKGKSSVDLSISEYALRTGQSVVIPITTTPKSGDGFGTPRRLWSKSEKRLKNKHSSTKPSSGETPS